MSERYYIELHFDSDDLTAVAEFAIIVKRIAPYMVDNVEADLGRIKTNGERKSIRETLEAREETTAAGEGLRGYVEEQEHDRRLP